MNADIDRKEAGSADCGGFKLFKPFASVQPSKDQVVLNRLNFLYAASFVPPS